MNLDSRKNGFLSLPVDIEEILVKSNIQQYYTEENGFDFKAFVQMAMNFDEMEAEAILAEFLVQESLRTQMNVEDSYFIFSDEELGLIYSDVMNLKLA